MKKAIMAAIGFVLFTAVAQAVEMPPLDPNDPRAKDRQALRDILVQTEKAFNAVDVEAMLGVLAENAIVVWVDGQRTTSHKEVRDHYQRVFKGPDALIKSVEVKGILDGSARFYGDDQVVAYGSTKEKYTLHQGGDVFVDGKWTTHAVKQNGAWKVAALHFSTNPFENDITRKMQRFAWMLGGGGLAVGLVAGWLVFRRRSRSGA